MLRVLAEHGVQHVGGLTVPVASLTDIIRSKEATNRTRDRAALPTLRALLARSKP